MWNNKNTSYIQDMKRGVLDQNITTQHLNEKVHTGTIHE